MDTYYLYTDGGCCPNPGPGSWAYILNHSTKGKVVKACGRQSNTTNNRMELTAVIRGLSKVPLGAYVTITSDSTYIVKGIMAWRFSWKKRDWEKVANADLWRKLDDLCKRRHVHAVWVRGHDGHPQNEECDAMAARERTR